ncbi:hypothetical protein DPMN_074803 [Dreissena polymorpha]|uniref:IRG-type G domain-containing protein n=1 Tax=Dreissena polymorpha TaxID=45954 RepID=A0A9D4BM16_DREPO|nr:hypothetical protein DPMN_074803 [Dreissena polymorpha]
MLEQDDVISGSPELSSDWYDDVTITDEVIAEFEKFKEQSGYNEVMKKLDKSNSKWKQPTINIAVTGETGTGKSTLINSLRGLKYNNDGAAKTGCTETTTKVTCYQHPEYPFLNVWDLPGVGTPNFTRDKYF